jgi:hypothetical protein
VENPKRDADGPALTGIVKAYDFTLFKHVINAGAWGVGVLSSDGSVAEGRNTSMYHPILVDQRALAIQGLLNNTLNPSDPSCAIVSSEVMTFFPFSLKQGGVITATNLLDLKGKTGDTAICLWSEAEDAYVIVAVTGKYSGFRYMEAIVTYEFTKNDATFEATIQLDYSGTLAVGDPITVNNFTDPDSQPGPYLFKGADNAACVVVYDEKTQQFRVCWVEPLGGGTKICKGSASGTFQGGPINVTGATYYDGSQWSGPSSISVNNPLSLLGQSGATVIFVQDDTDPQNPSWDAINVTHKIQQMVKNVLNVGLDIKQVKETLAIMTDEQPNETVVLSGIECPPPATLAALDVGFGPQYYVDPTPRIENNRIEKKRIEKKDEQ